jgi:hypothetical protein
MVVFHQGRYCSQDGTIKKRPTIAIVWPFFV